jgi:hypothetical protein
MTATLTTATRGMRVRITTSNGATVEGTLLYDSSMEYGSRYPVVETDNGWTYNYRYAIATAPNGHEFSPIPGPIAMEVVS